MAADKPDAPKGDDPAAVSAAQLLVEIRQLKTDLIEAEWKLAQMAARADVDPLLDIFNRRGFERELARSLAYVKRYGTPAVLVFIDLDGFKTVNDKHGHGAGDAILRAVASELKANVRASDVVARLGGDEFCVLMWNVGEPQAEAKARGLENIIAQIAVTHGAVKLSVGASAGIVLLSGDTTPAAILHAADKAMYARKKERKGEPLTR